MSDFRQSICDFGTKCSDFCEKGVGTVRPRGEKSWGRGFENKLSTHLGDGASDVR